MAAPIDPYANQGAEQNIDRQKALLNDIIASQGQAGRQLYERQTPDAQAALQAQLASAPATPDARKAVFDAYGQDAKLAEQGQNEFMQRQQLLNSNFLDQAKAAVPIHATDVKNQQEALRMQFEDAQQQRAAAASRASSGSRNLTIDERIAAGIDTAKVNAGVKSALLANIPKSQWTVSDAKGAGTTQGKKDPASASYELGFPPGFWSATGLDKNPEVSELQGYIDSLADDDVSFEQAVGAVKQLFDDGEYKNGTFDDMGRILLQANARRWGITNPADWGQKAAAPDSKVGPG